MVSLMEKEFESHKTYRSCRNVFNLPYDLRCEYAKTSLDCLEQRKVVNFIQLYVCDMKIDSAIDEYKVILICILIMCLYVLMMVIIADKYFAPALKVVARHLHMNEHLAGVTLLAFANNSYNLFNNIISNTESSPIFANTLAGALLVLLVSGGLTCYMSPLKLNSYCIGRDLLFFIGGTTAVEICLLNEGKVYLIEAVALVILYIYYIIVIFVDQILLKQQIKDMISLLDELENRVHRDFNEEFLLRQELKQMISEAGIEMKARRTNRRNKKRGKENIVNENSTRRAHYVRGSPRNRNLFSEFLNHLSPVDPVDWETSRLLSRIFLIIQSPIRFFCILFVPLVDLEENKHGWSKLLYCLNVIIMPSITAVLITNFILNNDLAWKTVLNPVHFFYPLPVTVPLAMIVFFTSRTDLPPIYHWLFAFLSIIACIFLIFVCSIGISQIMTLLCMALNLSEDFMGATIGAFASSIGDLVINFALASHGYGEMAFAAAVGGPFFGVLFTTSFSLVLSVLKDKKGDSRILTLGLFGETSYIFLQLGLLTMLLWCLVLNFNVRRSVGVFSIVVYLIFLIMTTLVEAEIIHGWARNKIIPHPDA